MVFEDKLVDTLLYPLFCVSYNLSNLMLAFPLRIDKYFQEINCDEEKESYQLKYQELYCSLVPNELFQESIQ